MEAKILYRTQRFISTETALRRAGIRARYLTATIKDAVETEENKLTLDSIKSDADFKRWYVLFGKSGSGKTYLMAALARKAVEAARSVVFGTAKELTDRIKYAAMDDRLAEIEKLKDCSLLIVDEINRISATPADLHTLFDIFSYRYDSFSQTAIMGNCDTAEFEKIFDEAFVRRFADMGLVVEFKKPFEVSK